MSLESMDYGEDNDFECFTIIVFVILIVLIYFLFLQ